MKKIMMVLLAALLLVPAVVTAAPGGGIELISRAEVEVMQKSGNGEGVKTRVNADKANVVPGDTVIFTISYANNGDQSASNVVVNNPVPENMQYIDKSAEGAGTRIVFSIDNGKSYSPLAALKVMIKNRERPARADDITNVKWTVEKALEPGAKGSVSFKAKVK